MKTREPPLSSKTRVSSKGAKDEGKGAPKADTPMARFREAGVRVLQVPVEDVRKAEKKAKKPKS